MNKELLYTIGILGNLSYVEKAAQERNQSVAVFSSLWFKRAMKLRKWNNRGEHWKSLGIAVNVWHKMEDDELPQESNYYELYDGKGATYYRSESKT